MKQELAYFYIGESFGGNQDWCFDPMMHLGGCAALTACDICIYLAKHKQMRNLCPFETETLNKKQYLRFAKIMKPYLRPRKNGVNRLDLYTEGFGRYLSDIGEGGLILDEFDGTVNAKDGWETVKTQIDDGYPAAYLMLKHQDKALEDFVWHWFLLVGYEESEKGRFVKTATYGEGLWLDFDNLWNTGFTEKGGMVLVRKKED